MTTEPVEPVVTSADFDKQEVEAAVFTLERHKHFVAAKELSRLLRAHMQAYANGHQMGVATQAARISALEAEIAAILDSEGK